MKLPWGGHVAKIEMYPAIQQMDDGAAFVASETEKFSILYQQNPEKLAEKASLPT